MARASSECPAWAPPLLALQFLTRVPVPGVARLPGDVVRIGLVRAVAWFPLVGAIVGSITACVVLITEQFWPRAVAVLVALIVEARLTGAFHEDAVADFCDGVGGGGDPAHVRDIMKDSRIGTYGTLGITLAVGLRAVLMTSLDAGYAAAAIIGAATFGRLLAVVALTTIPQAPRADGLSKDVAGEARPKDLAIAGATSVAGVAAIVLARPVASLLALGAATIFMIWVRSVVMKRVGGCTGDCLGFIAYSGQLIVLLAAASG
ncbi:MAG: adenosylcobinamide-GDP ribazoletransferase [Steroidobacteraceae bacterium]|nr:adenosylcobinamide-GDP ribazoletransferase [Steroidobacteraceae bacterium]